MEEKIEREKIEYIRQTPSYQHCLSPLAVQIENSTLSPLEGVRVAFRSRYNEPHHQRRGKNRSEFNLSSVCGRPWDSESVTMHTIQGSIEGEVSGAGISLGGWKVQDSGRVSLGVDTKKVRTPVKLYKHSGSLRSCEEGRARGGRSQGGSGEMTFCVCVCVCVCVYVCV